MSSRTAEKLGSSFKEVFPNNRLPQALSRHALHETIEMSPVELSETIIDPLEHVADPIVQLKQIIDLYVSLPDTQDLEPIIDSISHDSLGWLMEQDLQTKRTSSMKQPYKIAMGISHIRTCIEAWEAYPSEETLALAHAALEHTANDIGSTYKNAFNLAEGFKDVTFDQALDIVNAKSLANSTSDSHKYEYPWLYDNTLDAPKDAGPKITDFYDKALDD